MLTPREMQVCDLLHLTRREIGDILGISHRTVQAHIKSIMDKLDVRTRVEVERCWRTMSQAATVVEIAPRPASPARPADQEFERAA